MQEGHDHRENERTPSEGPAGIGSLRHHIWGALRRAHGSFDLQPDSELSPVRQNIYLLVNGWRSYHVKWIPADDKHGRNEVDVNRNILGGSTVPAPRMVLAAEADGGMVAVWEKLEGTDLRIGNRYMLPEAFRLLGRFHLAQRNDGPAHSNITGNDYATIREMIGNELQLHCSLLPDGRVVEERCASVLAALECGFTTLAHGDFHPGNVILNSTGLYFLDWAYAHRGVNLLDLDYVESVELEAGGDKLPWWTIGPDEAGPVLSAYFDTCGLIHLDTANVHQAVMLHAQLRSHSNARQRGNDAGAAVALRNVHRLLGD